MRMGDMGPRGAINMGGRVIKTPWTVNQLCGAPATSVEMCLGLHVTCRCVLEYYCTPSSCNKETIRGLFVRI